LQQVDDIHIVFGFPKIEHIDKGSLKIRFGRVVA
jgi:hypothetical protein